MRVGIAGIGKMGAAIAARLKDTGTDVVVWNRSRAKAEATGLPMVDTPRALAEQSDAVVSILFDAAAVQAAYQGEDGLLAAASGKLFIDMSTVRPQEQEALAKGVRQAGGTFVECPVGGTTGPARTGQLLGLVGGDAADWEAARPVLEKLCRRIEHMGPVGAGAAAKLAINLPLVVFWQSFGEALALVRHLGKDPAWLVPFFADTAGAANVLKARSGPVAAILAGDKTIDATFDIDSMRKDLRSMLDEGQARGIALPTAAQALIAMDEASAHGLGKQDCAYLSAYWLNKS
ncbi:NAD(P)-dependent oxidoreductase [Paraburkholderia heleia]|uniref:NAD(P)-dependent oxidoreductase n=1 Tax=Paraburkholderia heleia TaxID=634127 RepID=UPI0031D0A9AB